MKEVKCFLCERTKYPDDFPVFIEKDGSYTTAKVCHMCCMLYPDIATMKSDWADPFKRLFYNLSPKSILSPSEITKECKHEFIDVGFTMSKFICKLCDKEQIS